MYYTRRRAALPGPSIFYMQYIINVMFYNLIDWFTNYLEFPKYGAAKDACPNNCSKLRYTQKWLLYSYSVKFSRKALKLLFIFVLVNMGHANFRSDEIHISWEPERPNQMFFSCRTPENSTWKARLKVCGKLAHPFFDRKQTNLQAKAYLCINVMQALFSLYTGCFHNLMVCSLGYRKANKYTNIHYYIHRSVQSYIIHT